MFEALCRCLILLGILACPVLVFSAAADLAATTPPSADPLVTELVAAMQTAFASGGWLAVLAVVLLFAIRLFRLDVVQRLLPIRGRWTAWPQWLKWMLPFVLAFGGALLLKYLAGVGWTAAVISALTSATGAIVGHKGTKLVGELEGLAKRAKDPDYTPSPYREVGSIVIPTAKFVERHGMPIRKPPPPVKR